jgi:hypothetical protein
MCTVTPSISVSYHRANKYITLPLTHYFLVFTLTPADKNISLNLKRLAEMKHAYSSVHHRYIRLRTSRYIGARIARVGKCTLLGFGDGHPPTVLLQCAGNRVIRVYR